MHLVIIIISVLTILSIIWFAITCLVENRKDKKIIEEYLKKQRNLKYNRTD